MPKTPAAIALALLCFPLPALAQSTDPKTFSNREGQIEFATPSHNIGCIYTPKGGTSWYKPANGGPELACDIVEPKYIRVEIGGSGKPKVIKNVGERSCCGVDNILNYGQIWSAGPFQCTAAAAGLTCRREDGISVTLSKAGIKLK